ncbi:hypothetical protein RHGRI_000747 [Rhododendron griersonianum]|uniref:Uncharacterized protein n=1 Tax=Rhododendron griersonianum TaxID=479676 RepID=A0AAV6LIY1_9ERIC|nr:hypothetical protein RHGRI_000747 [Rhododendron griersonianum]
MEDGTTNSTIDRYAKVKKGSWFNQFWYGSNPWMARYVYGLMFLVATLLAWAVRDYGHTALKEMERDVAHFGAGYDIFLLYVWLQIIPIACCGGSRGLPSDSVNKHYQFHYMA